MGRRGFSEIVGHLPALISLVVAVTVGSPAVAADDHRFIGAEVCKRCHQREYDIWANGPHAAAVRSLKGEQGKDAKCNTCHTMLPANDQAKFAGIQCEACHGAGKFYAPSYVMRDSELSRAVGLVIPGEKECRRCHNDDSPSIRKFDFATMWAEISHGSSNGRASATADGG